MTKPIADRIAAVEARRNHRRDRAVVEMPEWRLTSEMEREVWRQQHVEPLLVQAATVVVLRRLLTPGSHPTG